MGSDRDEAARALYEERKNLLEGLMMPEAEPWDELPDDVKERWRRKSDSAGTTHGARGHGPHSEDDAGRF